MSRPGPVPETLRAAEDVAPFGKGRGLRKTLAELAARARPGGGVGGAPAPEPVLPRGARFDHGSFTCPAGKRAYRLYIPDPRARRPAGLVMMLHGCTQSPADFANGTGMNRIADAHDLIVVYPGQSRGANMQSCWNWFAPSDQERGSGEPAILAGLAVQIRQDHDIPEDRIFVAGLSAGGAMAVILGRAYPDVFTHVGVHSGLPYKAARDVQSAFAAMGGSLRQTSGAPLRPLPTIVFHGAADATVNAANGQRIVDEAGAAGAELRDSGTMGGRRYIRDTVLAPNGQPILEHWRIDGLGHAWSGGDATGSYADPAGPDASAEMVRFFLDATGTVS
jgi:poly(hydroxyalkanoate) depolymerase family esterase